MIAIQSLIQCSSRQAKRLTREQYAMNHPAGRIGKRLTLRVVDVMVTSVQLPRVLPTVTVLDALTELTGKGHGCVLVVGQAAEPATSALSRRSKP